MDWTKKPLPAMRLESRFGDRVVPAFSDRPKSVWQMVEQAATRNPTGEALVSGERRLTWRETKRAAARVAGGFEALGVEPGDRIALLVGNRIEFVLAVFACAQLGAVAVPMSTRLQKPEIAHVLNDCDARLLIHDETLADRIPEADAIPSVEGRIMVNGRGDAIPFETIQSASSRRQPTPVDEQDIAMLLYTSGTTGKPKGAMLAHCNIVHSAMVFEITMGMTHADRSVAVVPLAHVTGVIANIALMARVAGALIIAPEFKAADYLALVAREKATQTVMVPAMYNLCLLQADFSSHDLSSWRIGGYGGAPMPEATIARLARELPGLQLINAYGATETTSPSTLLPAPYAATHSDSVGLACPGARILAMDDEGCECGAGEVGEIWIQSASVVKGYWNNRKATAEAFVGGFWRSGDLGSVDAQGFVRVFDRKKDMINRAGLKIYSAEVESALAGHPDVMESAVVAKPCPVLGERVHAFVTPRRAGVDVEALRAWCAERLSDYKVPETITLLPEPLPRNANGKVLKRSLREQLAAAPEPGAQPPSS